MQEIDPPLTNNRSMSLPLAIPINDDFMPQGSVDFAWLTRAWAFFTAQPGVWVSTFLLYFLISVGVWLLWAIPTGTLAEMQQVFQSAFGHTGLAAGPPKNPYWEFVQSRVLVLILEVLNAVLFGGVYRMTLSQNRGERISALGLFSALPQAFPLILVGVALTLAVQLLEGACLGLLHGSGLPTPVAVQIAGLSGAVPTIILEGLLMFAPLLIIDRNLTAPQAIVGSLRLLRGQRIKAICFYFVASLVGGLGSLFCGIGLLATYPVFLISIALGYVALMEPPLAPVSPYSAPQEGVWPPPPATGQ